MGRQVLVIHSLFHSCFSRSVCLPIFFLLCSEASGWMNLTCQDRGSGWTVPNSCEKGKVQISTKISPADVRMSYLGWKNLRDAVIAIMDEIFRIFPVFSGSHERRLASLRVYFSTSWDRFRLGLYLPVDIIELKPADHHNLSTTVAAAFYKMLVRKYCRM